MGNPAAEFLERQLKRLEASKIMQEDVRGKLKLVMEHDPAAMGSPMPDIDKVFPPDGTGDPANGDWLT